MGGSLASSGSSVRNIFLAPRVVWFLAFLALTLFLVPHILYAQSTNSGTVEGVVTDPSAAAVVGANVTLTDAATGSSRSATTNDSGRYFFANVVPGKYTVTITKSGFRVTKFSD